MIGPVRQSAAPVGPSLPPPGQQPPLPEADEDDEEQDEDAYVASLMGGSAGGATPGSPYSAKRALVHDLTLPSVPNLDMPPSPPGSPPRAASAKFAQFLDLKRKGVHFNAKLEASAALRNPALTEKLLDFADIDASAQYETTLPRDIYDPTALPRSAYRVALRKSQERMEAEREAQRAAGGRTSVEFVPSSAATPSSSGAGRTDRKRA